tara:strand:+ start:1799 stop:2737 length:939 start_codon:yes stop_codon:yes gene_type:complete
MKSNQSNIKIAKKHLNKNMCVAVPTETVYGLAANAYSDTAVGKIFKIKKRPKSNPLIVHYSNITNLKKDCHINKIFLKLYKKFCPGPITFVLKLKNNSVISKKVTNNKKTLAVRFPNHKIMKSLLKKLDYPLAAPSANITTKVSAVEAKDVKEDFGKKISFVLDGGKSKIGLESTIIDLTKSPMILRLGGLEISKIEKVIGKKIKKLINPKINFSPGQSALHYSPGIPLRMNVSNPKKNEAHLVLKKNKNKNSNYFYLSKKNNLKEAGKNLYSLLRKIKKKGYKSISVEKIPNTGIGQSINDRLKRASKFYE